MCQDLGPGLYQLLDQITLTTYPVSKNNSKVRDYKSRRFPKPMAMDTESWPSGTLLSTVQLPRPMVHNSLRAWIGR